MKITHVERVDDTAFARWVDPKGLWIRLQKIPLDRYYNGDILPKRGPSIPGDWVFDGAITVQTFANGKHRLSDHEMGDAGGYEEGKIASRATRRRGVFRIQLPDDDDVILERGMYVDVKGVPTDTVGVVHSRKGTRYTMTARELKESRGKRQQK